MTFEMITIMSVKTVNPHPGVFTFSLKGNGAVYKDLNLERASRRAINRHVQTCQPSRDNPGNFTQLPESRNTVTQSRIF